MARAGSVAAVLLATYGMLDGALAPGRPGDGVVAWNNFP